MKFDRYGRLSCGFRLNARHAGFVGEKHQQRRDNAWHAGPNLPGMKFDCYGSLSCGFRVNARHAGLVGENTQQGRAIVRRRKLRAAVKSEVIAKNTTYQKAGTFDYQLITVKL